MTAQISLYGNPENFRTQKVLVAAKLGNKQLQLKTCSPPSNAFPFGLVPAIEDGNVNLFGADTISKYLLGKKSSYYPENSEYEIDQWLTWGESQLLPNMLAFVLPSVSAANIDTELFNQTKAEFFAQLNILNDVLVKKTFLVGERISFADISLAFNLLPAYQYVLGDESRAHLVNVNRWFLTVLNQQIVQEAIKMEVNFISNPRKFDETEFKKVSLKFDNVKKEDDAKSTQAKKSQKPKEENEEMDATEEVLASQPKFVDLLNALPPGTFVMDAFKRVYSNEDTATKAIPYFWENFDPENYSIWYCEYKFSDELKAVFMSCNLITGMFQRLERLKKHAFGSVCLFGTDNNSSISGIWIWRGNKLAFELCPDWQVDYESYEWKMLDPKSEDTKKACERVSSLGRRLWREKV